MDKLGDIPIQQQIVLVVLIMLLVAGGFYFLVIADTEAQITGAQVKYNKLSADYQKLAKASSDEELEMLKKQEEEQKEKIKRNRDRLPTGTEIPNVIKSIQDDATLAKLSIQKFDIGSEEMEDYYKKVPLKIRAIGTFEQLLKFFQVITSSNKRAVNIKDISVKRMVPDKETKALLGESMSAKDDLMKDRRNTASSTEDLRYLKLLEMAEQNERGYVEARFTIYAFSYTGQPLSPADRRERDKKKKKKKKR
jgi:Tfp pilus assembly protein PilO